MAFKPVIGFLFLALISGTAIAASSPGILPPGSVPGATNPDVTQENIGTTICVKGWTKTVRPPASYTSPIKRRLMEAAGIPWSDHAQYELDHRVPLEVGGNPSDESNLWIEPYFGAWNAHLKDDLELRINRLVCSGQMTLEEGQAVFLAPDWTAEYLKYFGEPAESSD